MNTIPGDSPHRIQMLAKTSGTTGLLLRALPNEYDTTFSNIHFTVMLNQYLSSLQPEHVGLQSFDTVCSCSDIANPANAKKCDVIHMHNCQREQKFSSRHKCLQHVFKHAVQSIGVEPELERQLAPKLNPNNPGARTLSKRADVSIPAIPGYSKLMHTDITVASHTAQQQFSTAIKRPLVNAESAYKAKLAKYAGHYDPNTEGFMPLVFESSGAIHTTTIKTIGLLARIVDNKPPLEATWATPTFISYWLTKMSCTLWRETAAGLLLLAAAANRQTPGGVVVRAPPQLAFFRW